MKIAEKYLEALKTIDDWVIVSDWAIKIGELYPDILAKAELEASNQANDTTGLREIAARVSSNISRGAYAGRIEIDDTERPRKIRFIPEGEQAAHLEQEIDEDLAPLKRNEIIKLATQGFGTHENYRVAEFESVARQLKTYFGLNFEVDHAQALLNKEAAGQHHPDNLQLLLKDHNGKKSNSNWQRFSLDEQIQYIETAIKLQTLVAPRLDIDLEEQVLGSLLERLKSIY
jgi:hypothetical protein